MYVPGITSELNYNIHAGNRNMPFQYMLNKIKYVKNVNFTKLLIIYRTMTYRNTKKGIYAFALGIWVWNGGVLVGTNLTLSVTHCI